MHIHKWTQAVFCADATTLKLNWTSFLCQGGVWIRRTCTGTEENAHTRPAQGMFSRTNVDLNKNPSWSSGKSGAFTSFSTLAGASVLLHVKSETAFWKRTLSGKPVCLLWHSSCTVYLCAASVYVEFRWRDFSSTFGPVNNTVLNYTLWTANVMSLSCSRRRTNTTYISWYLCHCLYSFKCVSLSYKIGSSILYIIFLRNNIYGIHKKRFL